MNRLVPLLLVGMSLAAIGRAQPAHAQWVKGRTYYPSNNPPSTKYGATTITTNPIGTVTINSSPPGYGYTASGSFNGNVNQEYTWAGSANSQTGGFSGTDANAVSGSCTGPGSANSTAGSSYQGGIGGTTVGTPHQSYFVGSSYTYVFTIGLNTKPTTVTRAAPLAANTSEYYVGTATASAVATLGPPVGSQ